MNERETRRVARDGLDAEQKRIARSGDERFISAVTREDGDYDVTVEKIEPRMETR